MYKPEVIEGQRLNNGDEGIDLTKIFNIVSKNWHYFLLAVVIGLIAAYLYSRYTPPVFRINARVLVNDQKSGGLGGKADGLMDLSSIMGAQGSVDNEVEILRTPDLIEDVVRQRRLNVVYGWKSGLRSRELYKAPFKLNILTEVDTIQQTKIFISIASGNKVRVRAENFDKELLWNAPFTIEGVGMLQLVRDNSVKMSDAEYYVSVTSVDQRVAALIEDLTVLVSNKQSTIVDLTLDYPVEKKGEEILTDIINNYKSSNLTDKNAIADSTYVFIQQRLAVIASQLGDVENKVQRFKQDNRLADMTEQGKLLVQSTSAYTADLAQAETQVTVLTDLENYLKDETRNKRVFPTSMLPSDMVFSNLMEQYNTLLAERDRTLMSVTEATPMVQSLNRQIAELRKGILSNIQNTKNTYIVTRNQLKAQLNTAQGRIQNVPQIEKDYLQLARNQQVKQELYIFLMQKAEETAISKTSNISIAKVVAKPKAEVDPVSPKTNIIYFLGFVGGLILPLVIFLGKDMLNTKVKRKDDIIRSTRVPIVGEISHSQKRDNLIVANDGRSAIAEQFRALRSNLSFYLKNKDQNVILLTSSMSGEGKSFTGINLANVFALLGKKVLLMELDLRKPGLSNKLGIKNDSGFSNYVIDDRLVAADIIKPIGNNLSIISSGPLPPNPVEILMSDRTTSLMRQLKEEFDYIIMDAPPIGIITDAESLVEYADITLYLVRQNVTAKGQLAIAEQLYSTGKIKNLGIIVNDVLDEEYGYGFGYGRYGEEKPVSWMSKVVAKFK
jgi:tyrosine-protein kinase Etk/Wzc